MRTLTAIFTGLLILSLVMLPRTVAGQDEDLSRITGQLDLLSPGTIQNALRTSIPNESLPPAFHDAAPISEQDASKLADDAGATKAVSFSLAYSPGSTATPESKETPHVGGPGQVYNTGSITYLIFDKPATPDMLASMGDILRASIGDQAADAQVENIVIADQPAYLLRLETETNGIPLLMDWIAVPVGKVIVMSMAMSGGVSVDEDALLADTEALSLGAIAHLQTTIEQSGTPAG